MKLVYITIGNSDNKLTQAEWANFCHNVEQMVSRIAHRVFFVGYAAPNSTYQNMCLSFQVREDLITSIRQMLRGMAVEYRQDSIAMAVTDGAEMVEP